ncbi:GNAT family N-acetyltransferase [Candidatus Magnetaquicoccus inordinatus]|uniref:GNAT family N-acetyltransferase n=1 Tax=Candidatus Magnetaquicoccus inordinatus TaxID=2496818 RepID=UPI00102CCF22|nr:GNAT family N-acetyltransferase [Candidatus Magnetaquicoccus inordinatus]
MDAQIIPLTLAWQEAVVALYNRLHAASPLPYGKEMPADFVQQRLLRSSLWSSDCSRLLIDCSGQLRAVVLANHRRNPGLQQNESMLLHWLGVEPEWQRKGWARQLLQELFFLAQREQQTVLQSALQWSGIWPGVPQGLLAMEQFVEQTAGSWQTGELFLQCTPAEVLGRMATRKANTDKNISIILYESRHQQAVQRLLQEHFSIGWQHELLSRIDPHYDPFNGYGLATTYNAAHPGKDLLLVVAEQEIIGFCALHTEKRELAFFGPIGLHPAWRQQGIGTDLWQAALRQADAAGCQKLGLWTSLPIAQGFYLPLGMEISHSSRHACWSVPQ